MRPPRVLWVVPVAVVALAAGTASGVAVAQDRDGDGVSDAVEQKLASDPDVPDALASVAEDGTGEGAGRPEYAPGHDVTRVLFGNVAGNRYVWCIEFLEDFLAGNSTVILYIDADGDPTTGRKQGVEGTDYQLTYSGGSYCTQYAPDGATQAGPLPRFAVEGKRLYCSFDVTLKQEAGQSVHRLSVLSEQKEPHLGVDSTGWLSVTGPGESEREKIMTDDDFTGNLNMGLTRGEDLIERLRADAKNVHVPVSECELDGFSMSDDEYREWSARRTGAPAVIRVKAPQGTYRPGIFVRDEGGPEKYAVYLDGKRQGLAIAGDDDNRTKLLFLDEPLRFAGGETLEFRAGQGPGGYRVESVIFLAEKPEVRERSFEVTRLEATQVHAPLVPDPTSVRLTWITSWPAACRIEYGRGDTRDHTVEEPAPLANHRVYLRELTPGQRYTVRVVATAPGGKALATQPVSFVAGELPRRTAPRPDLLRVPLSVLNATGVALKEWPVETGVALPPGALMPDEAARVVDAAGNALALQTEPRALWPDGSVKWLGLTFLATVGSEERTPLQIEIGSQVQAPSEAPPLAYAEGERVTVSTPAATLELPGKEAQQLLAGLTTTGAAGPVCPELTGLLADGSGQGFRLTVDPARTKLEVNGTVRCVVRLGGKFVSETDPKAHLFDWEARVTAYRGKPFVRVLFTVGNDRGEEDFTEVRSLSLTAALGGKVTEAQIGGHPDSPPLKVEVGDTLRQDADSAWSLNSGATGTRAAGWVSATGAGAPLTVAVRDFWQQYPKSLGVGDSALEIGLLPPLASDQYAQECKDPVELVKLYYYLQNGLYKLRQGVTKTHELYLIAGQPNEALPMEAFQSPLAACADPEWTRSTGAWGDMPVGDSFWAGVYDETMDRGFASYLKDREDTKAYGMLNFGDWWGERKYNWGNIEYDTQHAFFQHFVRGGDIRYYYAAEEAARHNGDVDMVHFHSGPNRVGGVYTHSLGHTGSYFGAGVVDGGSPGAGFSDSHSWTEGHLEAFILTGDRRHLENAQLIADFYAGARMSNYDFHNCREPGWRLILILGAWRATGDPYYLNAARIITERVIERERPGGGWRRHMVPGHCYDEPRHHGNAGFMVGVLMRGLKDMHLASGDERLPPVIVRAARKMVEEMYVPEKEGFRYTSCPTSSVGSGMNLTSAEGFGYAVTLSHDPELTRIFERGMVISLRGIGGMGKSISHATRGTPHALRDLESLAGTSYRVGPEGEYTFLLRQERAEAFQVQVRRLSGEGSATAELRNADGTWTQTARVAQTDTSAWVEVPASVVPGTVRLVLSATGSAAWTVMSTCLQDVVEVGEGFTVAGGKTQLHALSPAAGEAAVRVRSVGRGTIQVSAPMSAPVTERIADQWTSVRLPAGAPFCVLRLDCDAPVAITVNGVAPYLASGRNHLFAPE